jgi:hypothetical protein
MRRPLLGCVIVVACSAFLPALAASDWPQFRGKDAGVAANDPRLPTTWDSTKNVVWTTDIPGSLGLDQERRLDHRHTRHRVELADRVRRPRVRHGCRGGG